MQFLRIGFICIIVIKDFEKFGFNCFIRVVFCFKGVGVLFWESYNQKLLSIKKKKISTLYNILEKLEELIYSFL